MSKTLQEIAQIVRGTVIGDSKVIITSISNTEILEPRSLVFIQDSKHLKRIEESQVAAIIVPPTIQKSSKPLLQAANPKLAWAKLLGEFVPARLFSPEVSPLAYIAPTARIGQHVHIEAFAYIGEGAVVEDFAVVRGFSYVDENVRVGSKSILHPGVTVYYDCEIGSNVIIHSGSIIGADGFGYVHTERAQEKVPQVGKVIIHDDVELGACVTIDRATIGATVIGQGCKLDNLVQIGHNVVIKEHTVISAQSGISGSSKIGAHVTMGGKAGLGDHVEIGDWTMVGAGSGLPSGKKVPAKQVIFGQPARPYVEARKQIAAQLRSAEMLDDIRKLKQQVSLLEEKLKITR